MASAVDPNINNINYTSAAENSLGSSSVINPNSILDKDAFMKLLLTELKYQDPTSPMDTDKMLSQTADLTVVESQESIKKAIEDMTNNLKATSSYSLVSSVGKIASTGQSALELNQIGESSNFDLYFAKDYKTATVLITDSIGNIVKNMPITEGSKGIRSIFWDGENNSGNSAEAGIYNIKANYTTEDGKTYTTTLGEYLVESVRFNGGNSAELKLGNTYYKLKDIKEIKEAS